MKKIIRIFVYYQSIYLKPFTILYKPYQNLIDNKQKKQQEQGSNPDINILNNYMSRIQV